MLCNLAQVFIFYGPYKFITWLSCDLIRNTSGKPPFFLLFLYQTDSLNKLALCLRDVWWGAVASLERLIKQHCSDGPQMRFWLVSGVRLCDWQETSFPIVNGPWSAGITFKRRISIICMHGDWGSANSDWRLVHFHPSATNVMLVSNLSKMSQIEHQFDNSVTAW